MQVNEMKRSSKHQRCQKSKKRRGNIEEEKKHFIKSEIISFFEVFRHIHLGLKKKQFFKVFAMFKFNKYI